MTAIYWRIKTDGPPNKNRDKNRLPQYQSSAKVRTLSNSSNFYRKNKNDCTLSIRATIRRETPWCVLNRNILRTLWLYVVTSLRHRQLHGSTLSFPT